MGSRPTVLLLAGLLLSGLQPALASSQKDIAKPLANPEYSAIDVLRNKNNEHTKSVLDPTIKGRADCFVHVYQKPEK